MADPSSVLTFEVEREERQIVVHCHGRLVSGVGDKLYQGVKPLLSETKRVVLDLTDVTHMDSMGLGALVRLYVAAKAAHCELLLVNLGKQVRNLLGVTNMLSVFSVVGEHGIKLG
jgi:anti-sigma B factor antagonist